MRGFRADRTPRRGAALALLLGLGLALAGCDDVGGPRGDGPEDAARELGGARLPSELAREHPTLSPNASIETHLLLLEEASHPPHPGDGGGRMWLERVAEISAAGEAEVWTTASAAPGSRPRLEAGSSARFELVYEVGPAGVDEGGVVFFDAEPFWDWSRAQSETPEVQFGLPSRFMSLRSRP